MQGTFQLFPSLNHLTPDAESCDWCSRIFEACPCCMMSAVSRQALPTRCLLEHSAKPVVLSALQHVMSPLSRRCQLLWLPLHCCGGKRLRQHRDGCCQKCCNAHSPTTSAASWPSPGCHWMPAAAMQPGEPSLRSRCCRFPVSPASRLPALLCCCRLAPCCSRSQRHPRGSQPRLLAFLPCFAVVGCSSSTAAADSAGSSSACGINGKLRHTSREISGSWISTAAASAMSSSAGLNVLQHSRMRRASGTAAALTPERGHCRNLNAAHRKYSAEAVCPGSLPEGLQLWPRLAHQCLGGAP